MNVVIVAVVVVASSGEIGMVVDQAITGVKEELEEGVRVRLVRTSTHLHRQRDDGQQECQACEGLCPSANDGVRPGRGEIVTSRALRHPVTFER